MLSSQRINLKEKFTRKHSVVFVSLNAPLCFLEEERGQKRKRELDEEGEEDEDD